MLMTTQKVLPIFLSSTMKNSVVMVFVFTNMTIGTISQYYTKKFMVMMSLSSVTNLGWLVLASQVNTMVMWSMIVIYMTNVLMVFTYLKNKSDKENGKKTSETVSMMMMISSLAGMPPLMLFLPKWIVVKEMIYHSAMMIIMIMLILSSVSMYIYMRMFTPVLMTTPPTKKGFSFPKALSAMALMTLSLSTVMI